MKKSTKEILNTGKKVAEKKEDNNSKIKNFYKSTVAIRGAAAGVMIPFGHIILEPLGVPHGAAEQISVVTAGLLFTPEIIATDIQISINYIRGKIQNTSSKLNDILNKKQN